MEPSWICKYSLRACQVANKHISIYLKHLIVIFLELKREREREAIVTSDGSDSSTQMTGYFMLEIKNECNIGEKEYQYSPSQRQRGLPISQRCNPLI